MHWQHGQVVQGAPRIQNYQSPPSGAPEAGLQTLSHRCARLRFHLHEPRSAGHFGGVQTPEGPGLRGPVHPRWEYFFWLRLEHGGGAGHQVRVPEPPTYQGGDGGKDQPGSGRRCHGHPGCRCRKCEISHFTPVRTRQQREGELKLLYTHVLRLKKKKKKKRQTASGAVTPSVCLNNRQNLSTRVATSVSHTPTHTHGHGHSRVDRKRASNTSLSKL